MSEGTVEHIHIANAKGAPVRALRSVEAIAGVGLAGDRNAIPGADPEENCNVTLIEAENIEALARDHGIELAPGDSRRNITTRGVRLNLLVGREFSIGPVTARGLELCEPCNGLQRALAKPVIKPLLHRAGLRAELLTGGTISIGDAIKAD